MKVSGLFIYPVKSCRGIPLNELEITAQGPKYDRQWMLVDGDNNFITLRNESQLSQIKTSVQGPFLHLYYGANKTLIPIADECEVTESVTVWGTEVLAGVYDKSINEALSDFLGRTVKLVKYQANSRREIGKYATEAVKETRFADAHPVLLVNDASLVDLNEKLKLQGEKASLIERFRPNIVISGAEAFAEDNVTEIRIGKLRFGNPKPCARCPVITQDVETGEVVSKATLKTLADYRRTTGGTKVNFGINLTPIDLGSIRIGDEVNFIS